MRSSTHVAIKNSEHPVHPVRTRRRAAAVDALHWDDLRFFLDVATRGSLRAAATAQHVSVNTVRARVHKLEAAYGAPLLRRSRKGSSITDAGEEVLRIARNMQSASHAPKGDVTGNVLVAPGEIRIACSEGLGLLWLTPRLPALSEELDDLTVNLGLDYNLARDRTPEADITLTFTRPGDPEMIITRLATLHFMMFASDAYLRAHGVPSNLDEIRRHRLVEQQTPGVHSWMLDHVVGSERDEELVPIRTNSSLAQLWAVANGAGIAPMPTYIRAITKQVVPIDPPLQLRFDLFCTYHASGRGSPAIDTTIAWLRRCFDPEAYPWFRGELVHPNDFPRRDKAGRVVSLFDNMIDPITRAG